MNPIWRFTHATIIAGKSHNLTFSPSWYRHKTMANAANNTVVNTIDYKNTGIILRVLPRANANGNIVLDIEQEISNVAAGSAASLTPTISQR